MRAMCRRGQGAGHGVAAGVAGLDQPLFQPHHLRHHLRYRLAQQPVRGGGGVVPGFRPAQRIHDPHRLLGVQRRAAAPQRDGIQPPRPRQVRPVEVVGHPGRLERRLGRGMHGPAFLQHQRIGQEAPRQGGDGVVGEKGAERGGAHRFGRRRMGAGDVGGAIAAARALLQPARHGRAHRFPRPKVEVGRLLGQARAEGGLPALGAADAAADRACGCGPGPGRRGLGHATNLVTPAPTAKGQARECCRKGQCVVKPPHAAR